MSELFQPPTTVPVSGIWLRRVGNRLEVLAEVEEEWRVAISLVILRDYQWEVDKTVEVEDIYASPKDWNTKELKEN